VGEVSKVSMVSRMNKGREKGGLGYWGNGGMGRRVNWAPVINKMGMQHSLGFGIFNLVFLPYPLFKVLSNDQ
jgi:hypothetical protein